MRGSIEKRPQAAVLLLVAFLLVGCAGAGGAAGPAATSAPRSATDPSTTPAAASAPPVTSESPPPRPAVSPLATRRLRRYLAGRSGDVTAALYDARTKRTWLLHPQSLQYTASIVKVQIMGTALREAEAAGRSLPKAEAALMPSMIENSNNESATALLRDVGGPGAVARFDRSARLDQTTPSRLAFIPGTSLPGWGLTTTTALDEVALVSQFAYPSAILSDASRHYGLSLMEHVEADQSWGVSGGVPAGTTVALKNGWLPFGSSNWQVNSIGWVFGHGRDYVLAVLTAASPSEAYGIATIQGIARDVYQSLSGASRR